MDQKEKTLERRVHAIVWVLVGLVFAVDIMTPLGVATWVLYLIPLGLTARLPMRYLPLAFGGVCSVLLVAGHYLSPGDLVSEFAVLNRVMAGSAIWVMAAVLTIWRD